MHEVVGSHELHPSDVEDVATTGLLLVDVEDQSAHPLVVELVGSLDLLLVVDSQSLHESVLVLVLLVATGVLEVEDQSLHVPGSVEVVGFTEGLDEVHAVQVEESVSGVLDVGTGVFVVAGSVDEDQPSHPSD